MSQTGNVLVEVMTRHLLDPNVFATFSDGEAELVARLMLQASSLAVEEGHLQELLALGALHPHSLIRATAVELARARASESVVARDFLVWTIHDPDDAVATAAIRACRELRLEQAIPGLFAATGRAPSRLVGNMASVTDLRQYEAITALKDLAQSGPDLAEEARRLQGLVFRETHVWLPKVDTTNMVYVEPGEFVSGLSSVNEAPNWFPLAEVTPGQRCFVPGFYIDRRPLTNAEYDLFVEEVEASGHAWCHPDEPKDTSHRRSTRFDPRFGSDDPVTGCSWYDAYAYAAWKGKRLPSDVQWEKAARGTDGRLFPWGNSFDANVCNWAGMCLGTDIASVDDWQRAVKRIGNGWPTRLTRPSSEFPLNVSPYGVEDMVGNVWEWTRSRFLDREDVVPHFRNLDLHEVFGDWSAFVCVKGGSWASVGDLLLPAYRGQRHLYARGPEVGFRCVYEPSDQVS